MCFYIYSIIYVRYYSRLQYVLHTLTLIYTQSHLNIFESSNYNHIRCLLLLFLRVIFNWQRYIAYIYDLPTYLVHTQNKIIMPHAEWREKRRELWLRCLHYINFVVVVFFRRGQYQHNGKGEFSLRYSICMSAFIFFCPFKCGYTIKTLTFIAVV